jgi:hypothetical protein
MIVQVDLNLAEEHTGPLVELEPGLGWAGCA